MAQTVRPVPGPLQDGTLITVQGTVPPNANGFSINLTMGPGDLGTADIALHVNPRFGENSVVRNSFQNGSWGSEERGGPGMPFQKGGPLECIMLVANDKIMISFNGNHFCEFGHRLPKERVTHVIVKGDLQVNNVQVTGRGGPAPGGMPSGPAGGFGPAGGTMPGQPTRQPIPGGMQPGRIIYINGTPSPNAQRFGVNLKHDENGAELALHFSPRFGEKAVIKNSLFGGAWGQEERATAPFPFVPGTPFSMMILGDPQEFKIAVNGNHFTEFRLRNPNLQAVQWVEVEGDLTGVTISAP